MGSYPSVKDAPEAFVDAIRAAGPMVQQHQAWDVSRLVSHKWRDQATASTHDISMSTRRGFRPDS